MTEDFYRWSGETAAALRDGRLHDVDIERVAEEIESMGRRDRLEVAVPPACPWGAEELL